MTLDPNNPAPQDGAGDGTPNPDAQAAKGTPGNSSNDDANAGDARVRELEAQLERARKDAARHRISKREQLTAIAKMLGLEDEGTVTVDALAKQVEQMRAEVRSRDLRDAVRAASAKSNADPELVLAVLKGNGTLDSIDDPSDAKAIDKAVAELVKANPRLGAAPLKTGDDQSGGGGRPGTSFTDLIRQAARRP